MNKPKQSIGGMPLSPQQQKAKNNAEAEKKILEFMETIKVENHLTPQKDLREEHKDVDAN